MAQEGSPSNKLLLRFGNVFSKKVNQASKNGKSGKLGLKPCFLEAFFDVAVGLS